MKALPGTLVPSLGSPLHTHVRDLVYFDGPLLSEFRSRNGEAFLAYWCDRNDDTNRWLVAPIKQRDLVRLVGRDLPLRDALIGFSYVFFEDRKADGSATPRSIATVEEIPPDYLPVELQLLEPEEALRNNTYTILLDGKWSIDELRDLPRVFETAYYLLFAEHRPRQPVNNLGNFPWRGGFSAMHFFDYLKQFVDPALRPSIHAIQYASPGFLTFNADPEIGVMIAASVRRFKASEQTASAHYEALVGYIRTRGLNDESQAYDGALHDDALRGLGAAVIGAIGGVSWGWIESKSTSVFEAAKVAMTHFRRIKKLARFEDEGRIGLLGKG